MNTNSQEKKNQRITKFQKQKLVDFMSSDLPFARGQFDAINSNVSSKDKWESLSGSLNALGGSHKTVDQWKKCWIDLKASLRKQVNSRRNFMNKTGGGSLHDAPRELNSFEEQILAIISIDAVNGDSRTPESGVSDVLSDNEDLVIEILDGEEDFQLPKKRKCVINSHSKINNDLENEPSPKTKNNTSLSSKYQHALREAHENNTLLFEKLDYIEQQNKHILDAVSGLVEQLRTNHC